MCIHFFLQSVMHSSFRKEELTQKWTVNNAETVIVKARKSVNSPLFSVLGLKKKFSVTISGFYCFFGKGRLSGLNVSIHEAYHKGPLSDNVWVLQCLFSILNPDNEVMASCNVPAETSFINDGVTVPLCGSFSCTEDTFKNFLHNNALILQVKGTFMLLNDPIESVRKETIPHEPSTNKQLKMMYDKQLFTDAKINAGGKTFEVHRGVLASHSSVFRKLFEMNMTENKEGPVEISEIDPTVMSDLLAFIYTGSALHIKVLTRDLLLAADKYDIPDLADLCESELKTNLTPSNAAEVLLLAHSPELKARTSKHLKKACLYYIKHNSVLVYKSESWKKLKENSAKLAMEVAEAIAF